MKTIKRCVGYGHDYGDKYNHLAFIQLENDVVLNRQPLKSENLIILAKTCGKTVGRRRNPARPSQIVPIQPGFNLSNSKRENGLDQNRVHQLQIRRRFGLILCKSIVFFSLFLSICTIV